MSDDISVRDNPGQHRYEARIGGVLAGFAVSSALYATKWIGIVSGHVEMLFLSAGILASVLALEVDRRRELRNA